jgi:hypothetical protein
VELTLLWGALAGGTVTWIWGAISCMVLPWHHKTFRSFSREAEIERAIADNCPSSGVYGLPAPPRHARGTDKAARDEMDRAAQRRMQIGPIVTAIVQRDGFGSVPAAMLRALVIYVVASGLMTWLLLHTSGLSYAEKVLFVGAVGLAAGLICRLPDWNWHGYSTSYTVVAVADHVVGAIIVGLVIGRLV